MSEDEDLLAGEEFGGQLSDLLDDAKKAHHDDPGKGRHEFGEIRGRRRLYARRQPDQRRHTPGRAVAPVGEETHLVRHGALPAGAVLAGRRVARLLCGTVAPAHDGGGVSRLARG